MRRLASFLLLAIALTHSVSAQKPRFDLDGLRGLVRVQDVQISPDGSAIAVVVARANYDSDRFETELLVLDVASGRLRSLTPERKAVYSPRWSPAGDRIAFIGIGAAPDAPGAQVWVLPTQGGEARRITTAPRGVEQFAWSPDGRFVAYATEDLPEPKTGEERYNDSFEVGEDAYLIREAAQPVHLWIVADTGGAARRITSGSWSLAKADATSPMSFSPAGDRIAVATQTSAHTGTSGRAVVRVVEVATGATRIIGSGFGVNPAFSPDGKSVLLARARGAAPFFSSHGLAVADLATGELRPLTDGVDRNFTAGTWLPDSGVISIANDGTGVGAWRFDDRGSSRLPLGDLEPAGALSVARNGVLAFAATSPSRAAEVYRLEPGKPAAVRLTHFNDALDRFALGTTEGLEWEVEKGIRADGVLTLPPNYVSGTRYPLVVWLHGGPMGAISRGFSDRSQVFAGKGWVVFEPNYRGSVNRGNAFQSAIIGDAGDGPGRDVMAGVRTLINRGIVDSSKMAVAGWSYGGFMTTWLIGHYPVWKAAVAGAAVTDNLDSYLFSDLNVIYATAWGGSPWSERYESLVKAQSPITYHRDINTPTLILSNVGDARVPIVESYRLFRALKDRGVAVKFVAYPVGGHVPSDPVRLRDVYRRITEWVEEWIKAPLGNRG